MKPRSGSLRGCLSDRAECVCWIEVCLFVCLFLESAKFDCWPKWRVRVGQEWRYTGANEHFAFESRASAKYQKSRSQLGESIWSRCKLQFSPRPRHESGRIQQVNESPSVGAARKRSRGSGRRELNFSRSSFALESKSNFLQVCLINLLGSIRCVISFHLSSSIEQRRRPEERGDKESERERATRHATRVESPVSLSKVALLYGRIRLLRANLNV